MPIKLANQKVALGDSDFLFSSHYCLCCLLSGRWAGWTEHRLEETLTQCSPFKSLVPSPIDDLRLTSSDGWAGNQVALFAPSDLSFLLTDSVVNWHRHLPHFLIPMAGREPTLLYMFVNHGQRIRDIECVRVISCFCSIHLAQSMVQKQTAEEAAEPKQKVMLTN